MSVEGHVVVLLGDRCAVGRVRSVRFGRRGRSASRGRSGPQAETAVSSGTASGSTRCCISRPEQQGDEQRRARSGGAGQVGLGPSAAHCLIDAGIMRRAWRSGRPGGRGLRVAAGVQPQLVLEQHPAAARARGRVGEGVPQARPAGRRASSAVAARPASTAAVSFTRLSSQAPEQALLAAEVGVHRTGGAVGASATASIETASTPRSANSGGGGIEQALAGFRFALLLGGHPDDRGVLFIWKALSDGSVR